MPQDADYGDPQYFSLDIKISGGTIKGNDDSSLSVLYFDWADGGINYDSSDYKSFGSANVTGKAYFRTSKDEGEEFYYYNGVQTKFSPDQTLRKITAQSTNGTLTTDPLGYAPKETEKFR